MFEEKLCKVDSGSRTISVGVRKGARQSSQQEPVLVLLHGVTRMWRDWEPMIPFLSHDWTIYGIDQRGHGKSDRADSYLVRDYANDLIDLLEQNAFGDSVVLAGHSLGGMVAAEAAAKAPQRVRAAILEDPPWDTMGHAILKTNWQSLFQGMQHVCKHAGSIDSMSHALGAIELTQADGTTIKLHQIRTDEALRWSASCLSKLDPRVLDPLIAGSWLEGLDWKSAATAIQCPTILHQADFAAGGALNDQDAQFFSQTCRTCHWMRFPGKNHQLHGTIPSQIAGVIDQFLPK